MLERFRVANTGKIKKVLTSRNFVRLLNVIPQDSDTEVTTEYLKNSLDLIFTVRI